MEERQTLVEPNEGVAADEAVCPTTARGELFVLSAPSGTGKTTLVHRLTRGPLGLALRLDFAISHTTRRPRRTEQDGVDYFFVSEETFRGMIDRSEFLEWADVHGNLYGSSVAEVAPRLERGRDVLLDIDVQGAEEISERWRGTDRPIDTLVHLIFVVPPSYSALEERICRRGLNDAQEIARRLADSRQEMQRAFGYDYVIVNTDAGLASQGLAAIILDKRFRRARMTGELEAVLADFEKSRSGVAQRLPGEVGGA